MFIFLYLTDTFGCCEGLGSLIGALTSNICYGTLQLNGICIGTPIDGALLTGRFIWWRAAVFSAVSSSFQLIVDVYINYHIGDRHGWNFVVPHHALYSSSAQEPRETSVDNDGLASQPICSFITFRLLSCVCYSAFSPSFTCHYYGFHSDRS